MALTDYERYQLDAFEVARIKGELEMDEDDSAYYNPETGDTQRRGRAGACRVIRHLAGKCGWTAR